MESTTESEASKRETGQRLAIEGIMMSNFGQKPCRAADHAVAELQRDSQAKIIDLPWQKKLILTGSLAATLAIAFGIHVFQSSNYEHEINRLAVQQEQQANHYQQELFLVQSNIEEEKAKLHRNIKTLQEIVRYNQMLDNSTDSQKYAGLLGNESELKPLPKSMSKEDYVLSLLDDLATRIATPETLLSQSRLLSDGETIETDSLGRSVRISDFCRIMVRPFSKITNTGANGKESIYLEKGSVACDITPNQGKFSVSTFLGTVSVTGTKFDVALEQDIMSSNSAAMRVKVREGSVNVTDSSGKTVSLNRGDQHTVTK